MPLEFYLLSLAFAFFLGYAFSSERFLSSSNVGHAALILMGIASIGLIGWAIWVDTWQSGLIESAVILGGVSFQRMIARSLMGG